MMYPEALTALRNGAKVARAHHIEAGVHIEFKPQPAGEKATQPLLFMRLANGSLEPWPCGEADMFADDWVIVS